MDEFGLRMLANKDIRQFLAHRPPDLVLEDEDNVLVWIIGVPGETPRL